MTTISACCGAAARGSHGLIDDSPYDLLDYPPAGTIFDVLTSHGISWANYHPVAGGERTAAWPRYARHKKKMARRRLLAAGRSLPASLGRCLPAVRPDVPPPPVPPDDVEGRSVIGSPPAFRTPPSLPEPSLNWGTWQPPVPSGRKVRSAMDNVAVVAHGRKSVGGGLPELRKALADQGVTDPLWSEVRKSRHAPECVRRAAGQGADLIFVWGGDGTVQRCVDALVGTRAALAILPAGTANLLAANLGIPAGDVAAAVRVGLHGRRRPLDTGSMNGEHFAVMAGAGFDARMIADASRTMKDRLGRAAYLYTGARNLTAGRVNATVEVDGEHFFEGPVSCVLAGNVGKVVGGIPAFPGAQPDDGLLELGLVTAKNPAEWARTLGRLALGKAEQSPFVQVTRGERFQIRLARKLPCELDGGARPAAADLRIEARPRSITVCVPG